MEVLSDLHVMCCYLGVLRHCLVMGIRCSDLRRLIDLFTEHSLLFKLLAEVEEVILSS